ncbi:MAG TPA: hypothetical protein PK967_09695 [Candidatus Hydrogenedentes bacterium]|nr:hypothetical protein [Candidatus Hydrogenedentota bacterium]
MTAITVAIGIAGWAVFLLVHLIVWRLLPPSGKNVATLAMAACAGYGVAAFGAGLHDVSWGSHAPVSAPVFLFLAVLYFHFYFGVDRSVSVRTLGALARSPKHCLTLAELENVYPKEEMIHRRLGIMVEYGWIVETDGRFDCSGKGRLLARIARIGRRIYGLDATG